MTDFRRNKEKLREVDLYVVTSEAHSAGRTSLEVLDACLAAGVRMVQLREKEKSKKDLYELALKFREKTREAGCLFIVNDCVDLALAVGADGVHLGRSDLPVEAARRIAPDLLIGASSHNVEQAEYAQSAGADYVNIGPIFPTATKPEHKTFVGPEMIGRVMEAVDIPVTCMGGITHSNIAQVARAGAKIVAVVTAVTKADDMRKSAARLRDIILKH